MALLSDVKEPLGQRVGRTHNKDPLRVIASYTVTRVVQKAGAKGKAWGVKGSSSADTPNEREIYGGTKKEWVLLGPKVEGMGDSKVRPVARAPPPPPGRAAREPCVRVGEGGRGAPIVPRVHVPARGAAGLGVAVCRVPFTPPTRPAPRPKLTVITCLTCSMPPCLHPGRRTRPWQRHRPARMAPSLNKGSAPCPHHHHNHPPLQPSRVTARNRRKRESFYFYTEGNKNSRKNQVTRDS